MTQVIFKLQEMICQWLHNNATKIKMEEENNYNHGRNLLKQLRKHQEKDLENQ
jgi:hypothetical protein